MQNNAAYLVTLDFLSVGTSVGLHPRSSVRPSVRRPVPSDLVLLLPTQLPEVREGNGRSPSERARERERERERERGREGESLLID